MKGIILAGGNGTRLSPLTRATSKHLLPIYNKPMIYYPLSVLMLAGIREVLVICNPNDIGSYSSLLGDGNDLGMEICFQVQDTPNGISESLLIGEKFIGSDSVALILGDNFFYGSRFQEKLITAMAVHNGATIFGYQVQDATSFGVVEIDEKSLALSIEEKPKYPKSNLAITGLYFLDNNCVEYAKALVPSSRGELEITDVLIQYMTNKNLNVEILGRGFSWMDMGTPERLLEASLFVQNVEKFQGFFIACIEEIAYRNGWISTKKVKQTINSLKDCSYKRYLQSLMKEFK